jgi:hypothetical protein
MVERLRHAEVLALAVGGLDDDATAHVGFDTHEARREGSHVVLIRDGCAATPGLPDQIHVLARVDAEPGAVGRASVEGMVAHADGAHAGGLDDVPAQGPAVSGGGVVAEARNDQDDAGRLALLRPGDVVRQRGGTRQAELEVGRAVDLAGDFDHLGPRLVAADDRKLWLTVRETGG